MANKKFYLVMLVLITLTFVLKGCATILRNKEATVRAESGANSTVTILDNGVAIYNGPLPAKFPLRKGAIISYKVQYTTEEGELQEFTISRKFNWWVIFDSAYAVGVVIDLITGSIFQIPKTTILPISYFESDVSNDFEIILGENIPYHPNLVYVGNLEDL